MVVNFHGRQSYAAPTQNLSAETSVNEDDGPGKPKRRRKKTYKDNKPSHIEGPPVQEVFMGGKEGQRRVTPSIVYDAPNFGNFSFTNAYNIRTNTKGTFDQSMFLVNGNIIIDKNNKPKNYQGVLYANLGGSISNRSDGKVGGRDVDPAEFKIKNPDSSPFINPGPLDEDPSILSGGDFNTKIGLNYGGQFYPKGKNRFNVGFNVGGGVTTENSSQLSQFSNAKEVAAGKATGTFVKGKQTLRAQPFASGSAWLKVPVANVVEFQAHGGAVYHINAKEKPGVNVYGGARATFALESPVQPYFGVDLNGHGVKTFTTGIIFRGDGERDKNNRRSHSRVPNF